MKVLTLNRLLVERMMWVVGAYLGVPPTALSVQAADVVDSIGDVLSSHLNICQIHTGQVEIHRISNVVLLEQLAIVRTEVGARQHTSTRQEYDR